MRWSRERDLVARELDYEDQKHLAGSEHAALLERGNKFEKFLKINFTLRALDKGRNDNRSLMPTQKQVPLQNVQN